jgi:hypothetical protein
MERVPSSLWSAVQRLAGDGMWPPATRTRCDAFIRTAVGERLAGLLLDARDLPPALASYVDAARAKLQECVMRHAAAVDATLARIALVLHGEPYAIFGGAAYRQHLYDRPWLRPVEQLDVLVPRANFAAVVDALRDGGFGEQPSSDPATRIAAHHRATFGGEVAVALHHSFLQRSRHTVDYDALWSRVHERRLADDDAFLAHAASFIARDGDVPLIHYADLALMLARDPELPSRTAPLARRWQLQRGVYAMLRQATRVFGAPVAQTDALLDAPARALLDRYVLRDPRRREPVPWGRRLWLMDGWWRRLSFGASHAAATVVGWWHGMLHLGRATGTRVRPPLRSH